MQGHAVVMAVMAEWHTDQLSKPTDLNPILGRKDSHIPQLNGLVFGVGHKIPSVTL